MGELERNKCESGRGIRVGGEGGGGEKGGQLTIASISYILITAFVEGYNLINLSAISITNV